jgi:membrane-associated protease RseP (regulator of RpoE activity)
MEQDKRLYTVTIAAAVLAVVLSLCVGAFAGGAAGYLAARAAGKQTMAQVKDVLRDLQAKQAWPQLPEPFQRDPIPGLPLSGGAIVTQVVEGGPAEKAGIREGDVILAVDDMPINGRNALREVISRRDPGDKVMLVLWRQGRDRQVTVRLGKHPEQRDMPYLGVYYEMLPSRHDPFGDD